MEFSWTKQERCVIGVEPEMVFDALTDPERMKTWLGVMWVKLVEGHEAGVGCRYMIPVSTGYGTYTGYLGEIVKFDRPTLVARSYAQELQPLRRLYEEKLPGDHPALETGGDHRAEWRVTPAPDGTIVELTCESWYRADWLRPGTARRIERLEAKGLPIQLRALRAYLENGSVPNTLRARRSAFGAVMGALLL